MTTAQAWETQMLRLTVFTKGPSQGNAATSWKSIIGTAPDEEVSRPGAGQLQQTGIFDGKLALFQALPGRMDWNLTVPQSPNDQIPDRLQTIGTFESSISSLQKIGEKWLPECSAVSRLAFAAVLVLPVEDRPTGYGKLSQFLPFKLPQDASDFIYQINRPRISGTVSDLKVNRLSKWSVMRAGSIQLVLGGKSTTIAQSGPQHHACRLELDINTSEDFSEELPKAQLVPLFAELVKVGAEIASKGDAP